MILLRKYLNMPKKVKVGDPFDPNVKVGAIINDQQLNKILNYINSGKEQGASLKLGGEQITTDLRSLCPSQLFFSDVRPDMDIAKEEIFGPVLSIIKFEIS